MGCIYQREDNKWNFIGVRIASNVFLSDLSDALEYCPLQEVALLPPINLIQVSITGTSAVISATSQSGGLENGFDWQASETADFSNIVSSGTSPSGASNPEFEFTGLASGTGYYGRVRATGVTPSEWSALIMFTTIIDGSIFGPEQHAHLRGDSFIDINGMTDPILPSEQRVIIKAVDLSPNNRDIGEQLVANEYAFASRDGARDLDGNPCITFDLTGIAINPKPHLRNNNNWSGLSDNYTVIMVVNNNWIGNDVRFYFAEGNTTTTQRGHAYRSGSSGSSRNAEMQINYGGDNILFAKTSITQADYEAVMIKFSSSGIRLWVNGLEVVPTDLLTGVLTQSFSSLILGNTGNLSFSMNRIRIWDMIFVNDTPENKASEVATWHTGYIDTRYPSIGVVAPNNL